MSNFRIVVVGTGSVSQFWFPPLIARPDSAVVAIVEPDEERRQAAMTGFGLSCRAYGTLDEAVTDTDANLVVNLTPVVHHHEITLAALSLGCDVLGEKPMAADIAEARELVEAANTAGKTFAVMQNRRFAPGMQALKRIILSGAIGQPSILAADMFLPHRFSGGWLAEMESPLLRDMAIHTFDQARFLTDLEPIAVYTHEFNPPNSKFAGAAAAVCIFEFSKGAIFSYRGSWATEGFSTSYDAAWRVSGSAGSARWDSFGDAAVEVLPTASTSIYATERRNWPTLPPRDRTHHADAIDDLLDCLSVGRVPATSGSDNIKSLAMVFAALTSGREQRRVPIDELLPSGIDGTRAPVHLT